MEKYLLAIIIVVLVMMFFFMRPSMGQEADRIVYIGDGYRPYYYGRYGGHRFRHRRFL